jgi:hypothetical protein
VLVVLVILDLLVMLALIQFLTQSHPLVEVVVEQEMALLLREIPAVRVVDLDRELLVVLEMSPQSLLLRVAMVALHHSVVAVAQAVLEPLVAQVEPQQVMAAQALFRQLQGFL